MQVCTWLQRDSHASTPTLSFLQTRCPSCRPTNSVKALKANSYKIYSTLKSVLTRSAKWSMWLCGFDTAAAGLLCFCWTPAPAAAADDVLHCLVLGFNTSTFKHIQNFEKQQHGRCVTNCLGHMPCMFGWNIIWKYMDGKLQCWQWSESICSGQHCAGYLTYRHKKLSAESCKSVTLKCICHLAPPLEFWHRKTRQSIVYYMALYVKCNV